jgi:hypothetical protein
VRRYPGPGARWFQFIPRRLYCRECGVELRRAALPLSYVLWALMGALFVLALLFVLGRVSWAPLNQHRAVVPLVWVTLCVPVVLIQARWGTRFLLATQ